MLKKILAAVLALSAAAAFAAIDVNKADRAQLETVKGIGPALSERILTERKKSEFKDWSDLRSRVKGIGEKTATRYSAEGLTVNNAPFAGAAQSAASTKAAASSGKSEAAAKKAPAKDVKG
jgi:competence protein ComEA